MLASSLRSPLQPYPGQDPYELLQSHYMQMMRAQKANIATSGSGHTTSQSGSKGRGPKHTRTHRHCWSWLAGWGAQSGSGLSPESWLMCRHLHRQTASTGGCWLLAFGCFHLLAAKSWPRILAARHPCILSVLARTTNKPKAGNNKNRHWQRILSLNRPRAPKQKKNRI